MKKSKSFRIMWDYLKDKKLLLLIYIVLIIFTYLPAILNGYFWGKALEFLISKDLFNFFKYLVIWESIYILFYSILKIPKDSLYNYLEIVFIKRVSKDLYSKVDNLPAIAFENMGVGEFINRLYNDPDRVMELLNQLVKLVCKSIVVIVVVVICFKISIILGLEVTAFGFIMGFISYKFFPKIKKTQEEIKKKSDEYVKCTTENITGIREIKALGIKRNIENNVFEKIDSLFNENRKIRKYEIAYYSLNDLVYYILQFIILFSCGYLYITGKIEFSVFAMIEIYIWQVDAVVESISDFGVNYNKVTVSLKRIDEIINNRLYPDEKYGKVNLNHIKGIIEFKDVEFNYRENEDYTLKKLNLKFEPNKKIAVVGKSGNGKSTIFNLLLRYFDSTKGEILIDNIDIKELSEETLRNSISVIRQNPFIFNLSIMDNFKLVKPNVKLEEVREVCKRAYIDDYIMGLPIKYDTIIGEGGVNLSGGQKQRLAIARTLLINTKIILFDEATSALDNESQSYIKKTIDDLVIDHTVIIVAHRLSTIIDADVINVIDNGKLVNSGTHKELLSNCEIYKNLYENELE